MLLHRIRELCVEKFNKTVFARTGCYYTSAEDLFVSMTYPDGTLNSHYHVARSGSRFGILAKFTDIVWIDSRLKILCSYIRLLQAGTKKMQDSDCLQQLDCYPLMR